MSPFHLFFFNLIFICLFGACTFLLPFPFLTSQQWTFYLCGHQQVPSLSILCINWNVFLFIQRGIWWPLVVLCMRADTIFNVPLILWVCMQEEIKYWCPAVVFYEQKPFGNSKQSWTICPAERRWSLLSQCKLEMFLSTAQNIQWCNAIANHLKFP